MIGAKIRSLRKQNSITQDRLAECLGITAQAISRWESGICYPDIGLLPAIADYFDVTVDELLCVDQSKKESKISGAVQSAHEAQCGSRFDEAVEILRSALREHPSSYLLHTELACAIGGIDNGVTISKESCDEAIKLCMRVLDNCVDDKLRLRANAILCWIYARHLVDRDRAMEIARNLPELYQCRAATMAETLKILPPMPEAKEQIVKAVGLLLVLFGNPLAYRAEQEPAMCIYALIEELEGFSL